MDTPYGPHTIRDKTRHVAIPKELMDRVHLRTGDKIYFMENDAEDGTILIVPADLMVRWISAGRITSHSQHP